MKRVLLHYEVSTTVKPQDIIIDNHAKSMYAILESNLYRGNNVIFAHRKSIRGKIWWSTTQISTRKRVRSKSKNLEFGPRNNTSPNVLT